MLVLAFASLAHSATNTVTSLADSGAGSLRQVIADSAAGGTVVFGVTGTITLASGELVVDKDLTIIGPGASALTISGAYLSRVFNVRSNVTTLVASLTVIYGRTRDATGSGPAEPGGGICNSGTLWVSNCVITLNGTGAGGTTYVNGGCGAGIYNLGTLRLDNSILSRNETGRGGASGSGGSGGAIWNGGTCFANGCGFIHNSAGPGGGPIYSPYYGGGGGPGGGGGGIFNAGTVVLTNCTIDTNLAGTGGEGGYGLMQGGPGGPGGGGGGIYNQNSLSMVGCTIVSNRSGWGGGGGSSDFSRGVGGTGGWGGGIFGGGVLTNCTLVGNYCAPAGDLPGFPGNAGCGGGICGGATVVSCTIVSNTAYNGSGGGVYGSGVFLNSVVALNAPLTSGQGPDVWGTLTSLGHNLIGATNDSSGFTAPGDLVGSKASPLDPKVAPLANNGGSMLTMALLPGSPAIDAGDTSLAFGTDQRGFPRPAGLAADIGAFEWCYPSILRLGPPQAATITIQAFGTNGQACRLLSSMDLSNWVPLATNQIGSDGTVLFYDTCAPGSTGRYYRLVMP